MALEFTRKTEYEIVCERLIENFYPFLQGATVVCILRSSFFIDDKKCVARIEKISGLKAFLWTKQDGSQDQFFLIQLVAPLWNELKEPQQIAVLDHELCHIEADEETGFLALRKHTIEEFPEIVERHGAWHDGLVLFHHSLQRGESDSSTRDEIINRILNA